MDLGDAVVVATPFLRERDLRQAKAGETLVEAHDQVRGAIRAHYAGLLESGRALAEQRPLIAMGHLTVLGATTTVEWEPELPGAACDQTLGPALKRFALKVSNR